MSLKQNSVVPIDVMRDKTRAILKSLTGTSAGYALLDFPAHPNIGDSAIWAGEINLLRSVFGCPPRHVSMHRFDPTQPSRAVGKDSILFLHGGGNFGDIWPHYQEYRIALLNANPTHRIVQLPQSIHFSDPTQIEPTKRAIGSHRDFHLIVRDQESADFARKHFDCAVYMAPDSAFGIDTSRREACAHPLGMTSVLRKDKEQRDDAVAAAALFPDGSLWDWPTEGRGPQLLQKGILGISRELPLSVSSYLAPAAFNKLANWRIERGFTHLDRAEFIVTDRLHGHIMGSILGKPTIVIDNFYGKIRRFVNAWGTVSAVHIADDYSDAREMAEEWLKLQ